MNRFLTSGLLALFALAALQSFAADPAPGLPTSQPKLLTIEREFVKVGRAADHQRNEAGWPAAFEKAKSPDYYIALTSMSGRTEAWYLIPHASHAAEAASMKRDDKDPVLSAETARLVQRDAEFIDAVQTIQAVARPDLSVGKFPDVGKIRFYEITTYVVKPGRSEDFAAVAKAYTAALMRVKPQSSYRLYEVLAGMEQSTFISFTSVEDYGAFDQFLGETEQTLAAATAEERKILDRYGDIVVRAETKRFRVDPVQSYVPKATRDQDPDFWTSK